MEEALLYSEGSRCNKACQVQMLKFNFDLIKCFQFPLPTCANERSKWIGFVLGEGVRPLSGWSFCQNAVDFLGYLVGISVAAIWTIEPNSENRHSFIIYSIYLRSSFANIFFFNTDSQQKQDLQRYFHTLIKWMVWWKWQFIDLSARFKKVEFFITPLPWFSACDPVSFTRNTRLKRMCLFSCIQFLMDLPSWPLPLHIRMHTHTQTHKRAELKKKKKSEAMRA